jgi:diadenosine tetraphosphate (Ap4A) HIT family hydrolase
MPYLGDVECPFCRAFKAGASPCWEILFPGEPTTDVLWTGRAYTVFVDTAPLVPGHLIIVSNTHVTSLAKVSPEHWPELAEIRAKAIDALTLTYGAPTLLEHGAADSVRRAGACVDHAHLHVIPGNFHLLSRLSQHFPNISPFRNQEEALQALGNKPYIYYEEPIGPSYGVVAPMCISQYFRQLVSLAAKLPERWNWRDCIRSAESMGITGDIRTALALLYPILV